MKNSAAAALAGVCLLLGAGAGAVAQTVAAQPDIVWRWPASMDAVNAAPKNHKVLFENENISLLEVTIQPGEREEMHGHQYPSVFAVDAIQPIGENTQLDGSVKQIPQRTNETGPYPTCHRMGPQAPHSFHDMDTIPQHFYRLQFKRIDGNNPDNLKRYIH